MSMAGADEVIPNMFLSTPLSVKLNLFSEHSEMWLLFLCVATLPQHVPDSRKEPLRGFGRKGRGRNEEEM